jgi:hypothetical protein
MPVERPHAGMVPERRVGGPAGPPRQCIWPETGIESGTVERQGFGAVYRDAKLIWRGPVEAGRRVAEDERRSRRRR